jgi:ribA/ribD-fused uncharacterized protein
VIKFWRTTDEFGCFSNFSPHSILVDDKIYKTTEHYYQAQKAISEEDHEKIRKSKTPKECKNLAQIIEMRKDWESVKFSIMLDALRFKVNQHEDVKEKLLSTANEEIGEDSPYDYVWGLGKDGNGKNLLGKAWMQVREEIMGKSES